MTLPLDRIPFNRHDWEAYGVCRRPDVDPRLFFPPDEDKGLKQQAAREHCAVCPVRAHCFMKAMDLRPEGIWGGTSTAERQKLRKNRSRAHCPVCQSIDVARVRDSDDAHYEVCISCGVSWRADADQVAHTGARPASGRAGGEVVDLPLPDAGHLGLTA